MSTVITTTEELEAFCQRLAEERMLTVDTEFIRERTYWPQLCLVQIAGEKECAAIDPLAEGIELSPLFALMENPQVLKVFHAGKQDIEIFYYLSKKVPTPAYDTQIAAMVCGYGDQVGYESIVSQLLNKKLDKSQRFTDWARRPLSNEQIVYALGDVTYLRGVYDALAHEIEIKGRESWMDEELAELTDIAAYAASPERAWERLKKRDGKPYYLARLKLLAEWREEEAERRNKPRGWVLNDDALQEIAMTNPKTVQALKQGRMIKKHFGQIDLEKVLGILEKANALAKEDCPVLDRRPSLPEEMEPVKDMLKILLKMKCQQHQVAAKLVATADDLNDFLLGDSQVHFLHGWRHDIFGADAEALVKGSYSLGVGAKGVRLLKT